MSVGCVRVPSPLPANTTAAWGTTRRLMIADGPKSCTAIGSSPIARASDYSETNPGLVPNESPISPKLIPA
jgi:hypothetical protein